MFNKSYSLPENKTLDEYIKLKVDGKDAKTRVELIEDDEDE